MNDKSNPPTAPLALQAALKACPMCGGDAAFGTIRHNDREYMRLNPGGNGTGHAVNCVHCGLSNRGIAYGFRTKERAAEAWNRRTLPGEALAEGVASPLDENWHPRSPTETRDEIELFLRDAYAAGCNAAQTRSMLLAVTYAAREAPKLRATITAAQSRAGDAEDGPGVEDGPWAEGWQERNGEPSMATLHELADLHDSIRTLFIGKPGESFEDACESALIGVGHLIGLHGISVPDAAISSATGRGESDG